MIMNRMKLFVLILVCLGVCAPGAVVPAREMKVDEALAVAPDAGAKLSARSVTGPASAFLNQLISVAYTVKNTGDQPSGAYKVGIYLSADDRITPNKDRLLKMVTFSGGLAAGQRKKTTTKVKVPVSVPPGQYFYGVSVAASRKASTSQVSVVRFEATAEIVTDHKTGLIWQQADDGTKRREDAVAKYCDDLDLGDFDDWRLPRIDELQTIVDYTRSNPSIDPAFSAHSYYFFWSSTPHAPHPSSDATWYIHFDYGTSGWNGLCCNDFYVRCVRPEPSWPLDPSGRLVILNEETVKDTLTKLEWQRSDDGTARSKEEAIQYCKDLDLGDKKDWRMPSIEELKTIIDATRFDPAIPTEAFDAVSTWYWSSTANAAYIASTWRVNFYDGDVEYSVYDPTLVRCVRGGPW
jgi:hypothetical protein